MDWKLTLTGVGLVLAGLALALTNLRINELEERITALESTGEYTIILPDCLGGEGAAHTGEARQKIDI